MARRTLGAPLAVLLVVAACSSGGETATPTTDAPGEECEAPAAPALDMAYATEEGVDPNLLSLDIYSVAGATCGSLPVVVWVHGGGWRQGDKSNGIEQKRALADDQGWVLVSVNYRLSDPDAAEPVTYPSHPADVGRAVAFVEENVSAFGGDPERLVLMGHSAGAGIVSLIGSEPSFVTDAGSAPPRCVVSLDTEAYDVARTIQTSGGSTRAIYENAFGTDSEVWEEASPLAQLDDGERLPDFLVVTRGTPERVEMSEEFAAALEAGGASARVVLAGGYSHADVNREIGVEGETVITPAIVEFVDACTV